MELKKLHYVYFSPTGTTQSVLRMIAEIMDTEVVEHNMTDYACQDIKLNFNPNDIVVFGFPVYGGLVPKTFSERMKNIKGQHTYAVLIATYGNREYEDALLEMKNIALNNGFQPIGAAIVVTEHSVIRTIAAGRPDAKDMIFLKEFCANLRQVIDRITPDKNTSELIVPGKEPYVKRIKLPMAPAASKACTACGACVKKCPVAAISIQNPRKTDKARCIGCMRCVRICPQKARQVLKIKMAAGKLILCRLYKSDQIRREPEMFFEKNR